MTDQSCADSQSLALNSFWPQSKFLSLTFTHQRYCLILAGVFLLLAPHPVCAADAPSRWFLEREIPSIDAAPEQVLVDDDRLCYSTEFGVGFSCLSIESGQARHSAKDASYPPDKWRSYGLFQDGAGWVQLYYAGKYGVSGRYHVFERLLVRRLSKTGALIAKVEIELSGAARASAFGGDFLFLAYQGKEDGKLRERIAVIEISTGRIVRTIDTAFRARATGRQGDLALFAGEAKKIYRVLAIGVATGQKRWESNAGRAQLTFPRDAPEGAVLAAEITGRVFQLDAATGAIQRESERRGGIGYARPVLVGETLFVHQKKVLYALGPALETAKKRALDDWVVGELVAAASHVALASRTRLHVVESKTLKPVATFSNVDEWSYRMLRSAGDRILAIVEMETNEERRRRVLIYRAWPESGLAKLDLGSLPADAHLFFRGKRVGGKKDGVVLLPPGRARLDLLLPGCWPGVIERDLPPGVVTKLSTRDAACDKVPTLTDSRPWAALTIDVDFTRLVQEQPRRIPFPGRLGSRNKILVSDGLVLVWGRVAGLVAFDPVAGEVRWKYERAELIHMGGEDPELRRFTTGTSSPAVAAVLPRLGLLIVITEQLLANKILALEIATGKLRWKTDLDVSLAYSKASRGRLFSKRFVPVMIAHQGLLWGKTPKGLFALDPRNGRRVIWAPTGDSWELTGQLLPLGDQLVHFVEYGDQGRVRSLGLYDMRQRWERKAKSRNEIVASSTGQSVFLLAGRRIEAIGLDGKSKGSRRLGGRISDLAPILDRERILVCGNFASRFYMLRQQNLALLWEFGREKLDPCAELVGGGQVLVSGDRGATLVLSLATGEVIFEKTLRQGSPADANAIWRDPKRKELCLAMSDGVYCYPD